MSGIRYKISTALIVFFSCGSSCSAQHAEVFFEQLSAFFEEYVSDGHVPYQEVQELDDALDGLMELMAKVSPRARDRKAFYINAYNLCVIYTLAKAYPVASVKEINGFFNVARYKIAGEMLSLDQIEQEKLLDVYADPRIHLVLSCGAKGCPPLASFGYMPKALDAQLDDRCRELFLDDHLVYTKDGKYYFLKIFEWYEADFGGRSGVIEFINSYRKDNIPTDIKVIYMDYSWSLNDYDPDLPTVQQIVSGDQGTNATRYILAATLPRGAVELKVFNNLYRQTAPGEQADFFTNSITLLYGMTDRFNLGVASRYRRVMVGAPNDIGFLDVFRPSLAGETARFRHRLTAIGPSMRWSPTSSGSSSIQASLFFGVGKGLKGTDRFPFIDNQGAEIWIQWWNDRNIGRRFSLFTDVSLRLEDIGFDRNRFANALSLPLISVFSYYPEPNTTLYALGGFAPFIGSPFQYFYQWGVGTKYRVSRSIELELLWTIFDNRFLASVGGSASTYNIGFRYSSW